MVIRTVNCHNSHDRLLELVIKKLSGLQLPQERTHSVSKCNTGSQPEVIPNDVTSILPPYSWTI